MVTDGWITLSSIRSSEIAIVCCKGNEWERPELAAERINRELGRDDFRYVSLQRVEEKVTAKGLSFQEFQRHYKPPTLYCSDIHSDGEAVVTETIDESDYTAMGGTILEFPCAYKGVAYGIG